MICDDDAIREHAAAGPDLSSEPKRRMSRRMLLAGGGGLVLASVGAVVSGALTGTLNDATVPGGSGISLTRSPTPSPAPSSVARHRLVRRKKTHLPPAPAPMYYLDDGPKAIALTIDDGPSPVYTPQILQLLDRYRITASFSMIGRNVQASPAIAREVAAAGHAIVNHTWDHADLARMHPVAVRDEVDRATEMIHAVTGVRPRMFRAPYGAWSQDVLRYCEDTGLHPLDWSVDPRDWARPGVRKIVANIVRYTRGGSIILEHDGGGNRAETVAALKIVIPRLLDDGYRFRTP